MWVQKWRVLSYSSMYSWDLRSFLYSGVSNFFHNCGPLSVFNMQLFVTRAERIKQEERECFFSSRSEKLFSRRSKATITVTTNTSPSVVKVKMFLTYALRKVVTILVGNLHSRSCWHVPFFPPIRWWLRLKQVKSFVQLVGCWVLFGRRSEFSATPDHF